MSGQVALKVQAGKGKWGGEVLPVPSGLLSELELLFVAQEDSTSTQGWASQ